MRYTIIGGLNGVGKSTVYSLLTQSEKNDLGQRVNVDEIAASLGHWEDISAQMTAGKMAVKQIKECIEAKQNFHQESTLAGHSIIKTITNAKENGFFISLWYMYVDDISIAKQRVIARVAKGGHGIPEDVIERRSKATLETLKRAVPLCDEMIVYNNTTVFNAVAHMSDGVLTILDKNIRKDILSCLTAGLSH